MLQQSSAHWELMLHRACDTGNADGFPALPVRLEMPSLLSLCSQPHKPILA